MIIRRLSVILIMHFVIGFAAATNAQSCLKFTSPLTGSSITTELCTLSVETEECSHRVRKVEYEARYFPIDSDTAEIITIGSSKESPFTTVWDISKIPNQLFSGVAFFAEATLSNGSIEAARREGVFFLHQEILRPLYEVYFNFPGVKNIADIPIEIETEDSLVVIRGSIHWTTKDLVFIVNVKDPSFSTRLSREYLASIGVEILLDPILSRKPFPGKDVFIYTVPLTGKPYRIMYKPVPDDSGSFTFATSTSSCDFKVETIKKDRKGFTIICPVPVMTLGEKLPDALGCNLVVKTLSKDNKLVRHSWINASVYETYSPYLWGELRIHPRPILMNRPLIGGLFFVIGFFITLLFSTLLMVVAKPGGKSIPHQSDADRQRFSAIKESLDSNVIRQKASLDQVAKTLSMTPKKLNTIIKRGAGMNFQMYMMYAKTEIAKERLRSSHSTIESIAETCGFSSTGEMEKYFVKFYHITPTKFRTEQQVV